MKNKKRIIFISVLILLSVVLALLIAVFAVNAVIVRSTEQRIHAYDPVPELEEADCILILGAGVKPNGEPSDMLRDRLKVGLLLYEAGAAPRILISGDNSREEYNEPATMERYLLENGVPEEAIVSDYAGFSTYESLYRARDIFCAEKIIIVTQEYHLHRSLYVAEKLGLDAVGVSADVRSYRGQSYRDLREIAARNKDFLFTLFMPEPTYLGEKIPIK